MRRRLRRVPIIAVAAIVLALAGCTPAMVQRMWTDYGNNNDSVTDWTGADGTFSVELPDGRIAWLFSDTYLGHVNPDGTRDVAPPMVANSLVVQAIDGGPLGPTLAGTTSDGFIENTSGGRYWIMDGTVEDDSLWVFVGDPATTAAGIAEVSLPALVPTGVVHPTPATHPDVNGRIYWGASVLEEASYTYVYGHALPTNNVFINVMYLARVSAGNITGTWEYWTGAGWSTDLLQAVPVADDNGAVVPVSGSVVRHNDHYVLVGKQSQWFADDIRAYTSTSPTGPFTGPTQLYVTPEHGQPCGDSTLFTYRIVAHPEFEQQDPNNMLFSYNVHCRAIENYDARWNWGDASVYRARFVGLALP